MSSNEVNNWIENTRELKSRLASPRLVTMETCAELK